jgi:hypothetical protein
MIEPLRRAYAASYRVHVWAVGLGTEFHNTFRHLLTGAVHTTRIRKDMYAPVDSAVQSLHSYTRPCN